MPTLDRLTGPICCDRPSALIADGGDSLLHWCSVCGALWLDGRLIIKPELAEGLPEVEMTPEEEAADREEWAVFQAVVREVRQRRLA